MSSTATGYRAARLPQKLLSRRKESLLCSLPVSVAVVVHVHFPAPLPRGAFPPNHGATGEALTLAAARWSPEILVTS